MSGCVGVSLLVCCFERKLLEKSVGCVYVCVFFEEKEHHFGGFC